MGQEGTCKAVASVQRWYMLTVTWQAPAPPSASAACTVPRGRYSTSPGSSTASKRGSPRPAAGRSPLERVGSAKPVLGAYTRQRLRPSVWHTNSSTSSWCGASPAWTRPPAICLQRVMHICLQLQHRELENENFLVPLHN